MYCFDLFEHYLDNCVYITTTKKNLMTIYVNYQNVSFLKIIKLISLSVRLFVIIKNLLVMILLDWDSNVLQTSMYLKKKYKLN